MKDYYAILEVSEVATYDEIRRSYRRLSLKYHPDRNNGNKELEEKFKEINEAYQILKDAEERVYYDLLRKSWVANGKVEFDADYESHWDTASPKEDVELKPFRSENALRVVLTFSVLVCLLCFKYCDRISDKPHQYSQSPQISDTTLISVVKELGEKSLAGKTDSAFLERIYQRSPLPIDSEKYFSRLREMEASSKRDIWKPQSIYANDSCVLEGVISVEEFKHVGGLTKKGYSPGVDPIVILKLRHPIYLVDTLQSNISTNFIEAVQIIEGLNQFKFDAFRNQSAKLYCILTNGKRDFHAAPAITMNVFNVQVQPK